MIEKKPVEMGHGALFENVSKIALYGAPGLRLFLATVPSVESREDHDAEAAVQSREERRPDRSLPNLKRNAKRPHRTPDNVTLTREVRPEHPFWFHESAR